MKKFVCSLSIFIGVWICVEMASFAMLTLFDGEYTHSQRIPTVVHPYLGFVQEPQSPQKNRSAMEDFGFGGFPFNPIQKRSPDRYIIAIFGGSVAKAVGDDWQSIMRLLQEHPSMRGKEIIPLRFALGGYKQPQQLLTLTYLLALGAEFDAIVNIDGFNEVALPELENTRRNVYPFFPRSWGMQVQAKRTILPRILQSIDRCEKANVDGMLRYSPTLQIVRIGCGALAVRMQSFIQKERVQMAVKKQSDYRAMGPSYKSEDSNILYQQLVDMWVRSSRMMQKVAEAHDIQYIHILQPNQYVEGTKQLSAWEQEHAFDSEHPYRRGAVLGYPLLREGVQKLQHEGVRVVDATTIFIDQKNTIYQDACCHVNASGNVLLQQLMVDTLMQ